MARTALARARAPPKLTTPPTHRRQTGWPENGSASWRRQRCTWRSGPVGRKGAATNPDAWLTAARPW